MRLRPAITYDHLASVLLSHAIETPEFCRGGSTGVKTAHRFGLAPVERQVPPGAGVVADVQRADVFQVHARTDIAKVVEMLGFRKGAVALLVEKSVRPFDLPGDEHLAVAVRVSRALPDVARRVVSAVFRLPSVVRFSGGVAAVDVVGRAARHVSMFGVSLGPDWRAFATPAATKAIRYIREAFVPISAVLFGRSRYSADDGLLTGHPRRGPASRPAFPISKPYSTIRAVA